MCILLWTLPTSNHPRFKFALASNRDEFMARATSRADFWDLDPVLSLAINSSSSTSTNANNPIPAPTTPSPSPVGVLTGQDLQPSQATNYTIQELYTDPVTGLETVALTLDTMDIPGTWLGMTTHGDFVGLTNFRESDAYMATKRDPKLSRGKVCGEFLVTMAAAHHKEEVDSGNAAVAGAGGVENGKENADEINGMTSTKATGGSKVSDDQAERWFRRRAVGWEDEFEGLNLLVVQNAGDQQCVGGNRLGSELSVFNKPTTSTTTSASTSGILEGSVVGVSNSVFMQPWTKVKVGVRALESTLNQSLALFGTDPCASYNHSDSQSQQQSQSTTTTTTTTSNLDDDTKEIAWLVIQMLTLLRTNTTPFSSLEKSSPQDLALGLRERVFIPRIGLGLGGPTMEYGTRSSTITLFGREQSQQTQGVAVYVEKVWYSDRDPVTGERVEYAPDSSQGLVWWQGRVGQPRQQWRRIVGDELETLLQHARSIN
ncbi:hypothetical protein BGX29_007434 [Mortierella sp. GBA35]|nr:hypothetical protein BGX29_007434 [Mortierella sp. GBA35]